jgi:formylglycine-generating enzyme required for sulfatase activity
MTQHGVHAMTVYKSLTANKMKNLPLLLRLLCLFLPALLSAQTGKDVVVQSTPTKRIALIIGNKMYRNPSDVLPNTVRDADSMRVALAACGFEVLQYKDADLPTMDRSLRELGERLNKGTYGVALYYYSGHGLQVDGDNYLVPVDAALDEKYDVKYQTLGVQRILDMMEHYKIPTKILLLDACRDNPFGRGWRSSAPELGLAGMSAPEGTFIGFAASPGKKSFDGGQIGNGVYTKAILWHIRTPGISIDELFTRVAATTRQLIAQEGETQVPFKNSSLTANFYFLTQGGKPNPDPKPLIRDDDHDGFADDKDDDCPGEYGTLRGCPDTDGDGVADKNDACPFEAGTAANRGCPVRDADGDGVVDDVDKCKYLPGKKEWQGCPDSDGDSIPDHLDECPNEKGTAARKGCPEPAGTSSSSAGAGMITDPLVGTFILVKGGTFTMGCTSEQSGCDSDERPTHSVTLSNFYMGQTEVTQAQWRAVMGSDPPNLAFPGCDQCPVERVSWNDVQDFITKLNSRSGGRRYRLPTEAEWEYAARGGSLSRGYQYAGSNNIDDVAWYDGNSGSKTRPVKGKQPNELGLYDMSGNVWEWCSDWKGDYPATAQSDPKGPDKGDYRVNRGGSWLSGAGGCRVSVRDNFAPDDLYSRLGFRLAASPSR